MRVALNLQAVVASTFQAKNLGSKGRHQSLPSLDTFREAFCGRPSPSRSLVSGLSRLGVAIESSFPQGERSGSTGRKGLSFATPNDSIFIPQSSLERSAVKMASSVASPEAFVKFHVHENGLAVITLDRPKALNAMNLSMDLNFKEHLDKWAGDPAVKAVLVEGSTPRAFCSGGDVKWMTTGGRQEMGLFSVARQVFAAEYSLICAIARYPKPYISLMDGVTMGFGIGLSGHGSFRVITERTVLAMPENAIGLFPDVGFAHIARRSAGGGALGYYLALTGTRVTTPADAALAGIPTHVVSSAALPELKSQLSALTFDSDARASVDTLLRSFAAPHSAPGVMAERLPDIERCFGGGKAVGETVEELREAAGGARGEEVAVWARGALEGIQRGGPWSLVATQRHFAAVLGAAPGSELAEIEGVMRVEYRLAMRSATRWDFVEGVRAVLVDKDQKPKWGPETLEAVDENEVQASFSPFEDEKLELQLA